MTIRTDIRMVTFRAAFRLTGLDDEQPPGTYAIEIEEERLEPLSFAAYRRTATRIRVPLRGLAGSSQTVVIDPAELEAALARDGAPEQG